MSGSHLLILVGLVLFVGLSEAVSSINRTTHYYVGKEKITWDEAVRVCQLWSMELVSVQNKEKNDDIVNFLNLKGIKSNGDEAFWTAGNRFEDKKTWFWWLTTPITYFNWSTGEPNNARGNEEYITIFQKDNSMVWNDAPASLKFYPLCEKTITTCTCSCTF